MPYLAILPYPDFNLAALTYFHIIKLESSDKPVASSLSILVDNNNRNFLYNNINRFKSIINKFFFEIDRLFTKGYKTVTEVEPLFKDFLLKIIEIERKPVAPITSERKMKIVLAGLDSSGKTSFLLSIDRRFSKIIGLKPTISANVSSIQVLGASIFLWDLGGQKSLREKYLSKSQVYLYETDLVFYFIDIKNRERFNESIEYYRNIIQELEKFNQNTPIIFILSKSDEDILNTKEIKENLTIIKSKLSEITKGIELEFYQTSVFSIFSILNAFSQGISKLSPNRELIRLNLKKFSDRAGINLLLLLNHEGYVLAEYISKETKFLSDMISDYQTEARTNLLNIFQITAPQFATLYKIFIEFRALKKDEAIFKISNSFVLIKKIQISDFIMFILFVMDNENKKDLINSLIPDFTYRTSDLLLRYIS
jgi:small GTP-binding protein